MLAHFERDRNRSDQNDYKNTISLLSWHFGRVHNNQHSFMGMLRL
jgi:hypothetical protein